MKAVKLLEAWLQRELPADAWAWLSTRGQKLIDNNTDRELSLAVALAPRKLGKADLILNHEDMQNADAVRAGFEPVGWSVDQAARLWLILKADWPEHSFAKKLDQLFLGADVGELMALYRGLPLYPDPSAYLFRATDGLRSNIRPVFEAIAHYNPYPMECFDEGAWNQMVLKALFIGAPLYAIRGVDQRANPTLTRMLCDYAHERWAANRPISIELWRSVGPGADHDALTDLEKVLTQGDLYEQQAAALALTRCTISGAAELLAKRPDLRERIDTEQLTWESLVTQWNADQT